MKRKYYMRGLGIGVIVTAILCSIAVSRKEPAMTDEEIIARAQELGYTKASSGVTPEDIDRLKEKEQGALTPGATSLPKATPDVSPGPTLSPVPTPEAPNPPEKPDKPETATPAVDKKPTQAATPKPTATTAPTEVPTESPRATATPKPTGTPGTISYTITVERGATASRVAEQLEAAGAIADAQDFVKYLRNANLTDFINIGTFTIPQGAGYEEIARILTK